MPAIDALRIRRILDSRGNATVEVEVRAGGAGRIPPYPLGNVIGGGRHAIGGTDIQEYLSLAQSHAPSKAVFANARVHRLPAAGGARGPPGGPAREGGGGAGGAQV